MSELKFVSIISRLFLQCHCSCCNLSLS